MTSEAARDALIELGRNVHYCAKHGDTWCSCKVRQFLDALLEARATCPTCGGRPQHFGALLVNDDNTVDGLVGRKCPSCGGEPGELLVLLALGGVDIGDNTWAFPIPSSTPDSKET